MKISGAAPDRGTNASTTLISLPEKASRGTRIVTLLAVIVPFLGLPAAAIFLWGSGFSFVHLGLFVGMYLLTALGITVGYHRLFTHRSFEAGRVVELIFGVLGSMAVQGPIVQWVADHRRHHQKSDQPGDPHSPRLHGSGLLGVLRGLWHAHMGWLFSARTVDVSRYAPDLMKNKLVRRVSRLFPLWVVLGLTVPTVLGGLFTGSWTGALLGFLWGGLVRIFFVHHVTWSVNSVCHLWGSQSYQSGDGSRNNVLFGLLGLGEGWHNNHHAFPTSARHGLKPWQLDLSYLVIRLLELCGLARNVKLAVISTGPEEAVRPSVARMSACGGER